MYPTSSIKKPLYLIFNNPVHQHQEGWFAGKFVLPHQSTA